MTKYIRWAIQNEKMAIKFLSKNKIYLEVKPISSINYLKVGLYNQITVANLKFSLKNIRSKYLKAIYVKLYLAIFQYQRCFTYLFQKQNKLLFKLLRLEENDSVNTEISGQFSNLILDRKFRRNYIKVYKEYLEKVFLKSDDKKMDFKFLNRINSSTISHSEFLNYINQIYGHIKMLDEKFYKYLIQLKKEKYIKFTQEIVLGYVIQKNK